MKKSIWLCGLILVLSFLASAIVVHGAEKPYVLRVSSFLAAVHHINRNMFDPFIKEVESESKGGIKCDFYLAEALGKAKDHADLAKTGIADVVFIVQSYTPGRFSLSTVTELPFTFPNSTDACKASWKLYKSHLYRQYADYHVLFLGNTSGYILCTRTKPLRTFDEMKAVKIRTSGGYITKAFESLGITPVSMPGVEIYTSVERGVMEGYVSSYASIPGYRLEEVTKYVTEVNLGNLCIGMLMNKQAYEKLPPDLKEIVNKAGEHALQNISASYDKEDSMAKEMMMKKGIEVIVPAPPEMKRIHAAGMRVWKDWVQEMEAKRLPGRTVMDAYIKLLPKDIAEAAQNAIR
jgi:TRAP-type C4-dicarboxylate transport system substrate-binding protein